MSILLWVSAPDSPRWHIHSDCSAKQGKTWTTQRRDLEWHTRPWMLWTYVRMWKLFAVPLVCLTLFDSFLILISFSWHKSDLKFEVLKHAYGSPVPDADIVGSHPVGLEERNAASAHICLTIAPLHNHSVEKHSKNYHHYTSYIVYELTFSFNYRGYIPRSHILFKGDPEIMLRIIIEDQGGWQRGLFIVLYSNR